MFAKKIAVIGGGIAGLAVACRLAKDGHSVQLFEKNEQIGGKLNYFEKEGFQFDTGPSLFTLPEHIQELFDYCDVKLDEYLDYAPLNPLCKYFWSDKKELLNYQDVDQSCNAVASLLEDKNHPDVQAYRDFLKYSQKIYELTAPAFLHTPLYEFDDLKKLNILDFFKIDAFTNVHKRVNHYFKSPYLRQFFKRFATYNGSNPYVAPATLNVIPHVELNMGGYYVKGGMYSIAKALNGLAIKLGVQIHISSSVKEIYCHTHKKEAEGIILENGEKLEFDYIFSNSDAIYTHTALVSDTNLHSSKKSQLKNEEASSSAFVLYLGVNKRYEQLEHHNIFFSSDYKNEFDQLFKHKSLNTDPTIYIAWTGKHDQTMAPKGASNLFIMINAPSTDGKIDWEKDKEAQEAIILDALEKNGLTDLRKHIVVKEYLSPADLEQKYFTFKGGIYGTSSNSRMAAFARPKNRSNYIQRLFLVGGSCHPGGGIPLVLLSAKHAHTLLSRILDDEKRYYKKTGRRKIAKY